MSGTRVHVRGRFGRLAAALAVAGGTLIVSSVALGVASGPAGASSCGVALGVPQLEGALGSLEFSVPALPTVPGEACNATIAVTGTIATSGGIRPTNVVGNGASSNVTVSFLPGEPGPDILWEWSPHCADPASLPYDFFASSPATGATSVPVSPVSPCSSFGNVTSSTLRPPIVLVPNPATYVAMAGGDGNLGYWLIQRGGGISPFGSATNAGMPFTNVSVAGIANAGGGGTGWPTRTAACSPSGAPPSSAPWAGCPSMRRSWASQPPLTTAATGWRPPTAASTPSATPPSTARSPESCHQGHR